MSGTYSDPISRIAQGFHQPAYSPLIGRRWNGNPGTYVTPEFPPGPGWMQVAAGAARRPGELAGAGCGCNQASLTPGGVAGRRKLSLAAVDDPQAMSTATYAGTSLAGAAAGGALLGYVASGSSEGAKTGALFSTGLGALSDAVLFGRESNHGAMAAMALIGLGALSWSLLRFRESVR